LFAVKQYSEQYGEISRKNLKQYKVWILYIYRNTDKLVSSPEKLLKHISDTVDKRIVLPAVTEACIRDMMEFNYPNRSGMNYEIGFR